MATTCVALAGPADITPALRQKAQAICTADAMRLCPDAMGDEGEVVACMKTLRPQLTVQCRQVYDQVAKALKL